MDIIIITGGSKGIGKALVDKYSAEDYKVYSISRNGTNTKKSVHISIDLSDVNEIAIHFSELLNSLKTESFSSLTLINNAGRLGEIKPLAYLNATDISKTITLNTTAPLVLSSMFIQFASRYSCKKKIINISSGAASSPYSGWSPYCVSKAGIDMLTKTIATEQKTTSNPVECYGIRPGVVDTEMQMQIRNTPKKDFEKLQKFINLKENNQLYTTKLIAETIFKLDKKNLLISGEIVDVRSINNIIDS